MIIGKIIGGLGNQMFQYAFYRYLADLKSTLLYLDISDFYSYHLHNGFELDKVFSIDENIADERIIKQFKSPWPILTKLENKIFSRNSKFSKNHFIENKFIIDEKIFNPMNNNFYVEGYFQNYKYVESFQSLNKDIFKFTNVVDEREREILSSNSVSIHIRGGDYLSNLKDAKLFGNICNHDYYMKSIELIKAQISSPNFFVFTDDKEYAEYLLKDYKVTFISGNNAQNSFKDMRLMSLCKNNIIANSSFSWWGAYLNINKNKIVVAPNKWFNDSNIDQENIIPPAWKKI
jgi:hypothetical protein